MQLYCLQISIHSPHARGDCPSPCRPSRRTYFNPLPSREGRHLGIDIDKAVREFQSTPLMRGETQAREAKNIWRLYFNPLPSYEGRLSLARSCVRATHFNPLPSHEGRQRRWRRVQERHLISIHSPHTRGDERRKGFGAGVRRISIHSPHTRGDLRGLIKNRAMCEFQSTPLTRGETLFNP